MNKRSEIIVDGWCWKYSSAYRAYVIEGRGATHSPAWFIYAYDEAEVRQKTARLKADDFKPIDDYIVKDTSTGPLFEKSTVPEGSQGNQDGSWRVVDGEWKGRTT